MCIARDKSKVPCFFRLKDSSGWQHVFTSTHIDNCIERIAINAKMGSGGAGETSKMVAISYGSQVRLWGISDDGAKTNIGRSFRFQSNQF